MSLPTFLRTAWEKKGSWRLDVHQVTKPNGENVEVAYVRHPGAVVLVPLLDDETVLLLSQFRPALGRTILELPAGTREWGEEWLTCAQRELREETGYRAAQLSPLGAAWPVPGSSDEEQMLYLAEGLTPDPLPMDFDEQIEVVPTAVEDALRRARDGEIADAKTVVALFWAARSRGWPL